MLAGTVPLIQPAPRLRVEEDYVLYRHTCFCPTCQPRLVPVLPPQGPLHLCWMRGQHRGWTPPEYGRWLILCQQQRLFRCVEVNAYAHYAIVQMWPGKRGHLPGDTWEAHMCRTCGEDLCKDVVHGRIEVIDMRQLR